MIALVFKNESDFNKALDIIIDINFDEEIHPPGGNVLIVSRECEQWIKDAGIDYEKEEVISGADIPQEDLNRLRKENLFRR